MYNIAGRIWNKRRAFIDLIKSPNSKKLADTRKYAGGEQHHDKGEKEQWHLWHMKHICTFVLKVDLSEVEKIGKHKVFGQIVMSRWLCQSAVECSWSAGVSMY